MYGVKALDPVIRDTATVIGVGRLRRFFGVVMPSAAPYIATGLRVAAAGALGIAVTLLFSAAERRLLRWHEAYR
jgi:ABC-type nitrate/sulfonate/bicarbonate transport system permease component